MARQVLSIRLVICFLFLSTGCFAQVDTVAVVSRNGIDAKFTYRKYRSKSELQEIKFPHYSTTKNNIARISALLTEFTQAETKYNALVKVQHDMDSIHRTKEQKLEETITLERQRAENFERTTQELTRQYNALDKNLKDCENLAKSTRKESWWRGAKQVGILALATGVLTGVLIAK